MHVFEEIDRCLYYTSRSSFWYWLISQSPSRSVEAAYPLIKHSKPVWLKCINNNKPSLREHSQSRAAAYALVSTWVAIFSHTDPFISWHPSVYLNLVWFQEQWLDNRVVRLIVVLLDLDLYPMRSAARLGHSRVYCASRRESYTSCANGNES